MMQLEESIESISGYIMGYINACPLVTEQSRIYSFPKGSDIVVEAYLIDDIDEESNPLVYTFHPKLVYSLELVNEMMDNIISYSTLTFDDIRDESYQTDLDTHLGK